MINTLKQHSKKTFIKTITLKMTPILSIIYGGLIFSGYSDLANTALVNLIQTIFLSFLILLIHKGLKLLISNASEKILDAGSDSQKKLLVYWSMVFFDTILFILFIISLFLVWGAYPQSIYHTLDVIFLSGIKVGESSFSVLHIAKAIVIYLTVYYLFKLILFVLDNHAFPYTNFDDGAKNAISTVIGYVGLIAAVIMAVYSLGLTSTSLAFILSAFTFGISFGLKEIFSNFISGLILLIERPIKIGDWVNVGNESGEVKKIRLRSTMVETFDKKTLMIPNSQFITATVSNDLYNPIARATVDIECSYNDNPVQVQELLMALAAKVPGILSKPAPCVIFTGFGASGLGFQLRFFCETTEKVKLTSQMRFEIIKAFRENNIEMPYTKQDLYIKELPEKA